MLAEYLNKEPRTRIKLILRYAPITLVSAILILISLFLAHKTINLNNGYLNLGLCFSLLWEIIKTNINASIITFLVCFLLLDLHNEICINKES